jgi:hypothetical protein
VGVHPRSLRRALEDLHVLGLEDAVERLAVLAVTITQQKAQGFHAYAHVDGEIPRLLHRPIPRRMGGDPGDVQAPGTVLEERQRVQPPTQRGVDVEEICRDDALGLDGEELTSSRAGTTRRRVDARGVQYLPDRGGGDLVPESGQLPLDPPVSPLRILLAQPQDERLDRRP